MLFLCAFGIISTFCFNAAEPSCSKYHYEEQILERVIKSEFLMQDFQKQFAGLVDKVTSDLKSFKDDIGILRNDWKAFSKQTAQSVSTAIEDMNTRQRDMETNVTTGIHTLELIGNNLTRQMKTIKDTTRPPHVSFHARTPTDMLPFAGNTLIYKTVEENLGIGYDTSTGVFTATVHGVYVFSVNICSKNMDYLDISIVKDDSLLVGTRLVDKTYYYCVTLHSHAVLEKGDRVWVKVTDGGKLVDSYGNYWNSFSGLLVHQ